MDLETALRSRLKNIIDGYAVIQAQLLTPGESTGTLVEAFVESHYMLPELEAGLPTPESIENPDPIGVGHCVIVRESTPTSGADDLKRRQVLSRHLRRLVPKLPTPQVKVWFEVGAPPEDATEKKEVKMLIHASKHFRLFVSLALVGALALVFFGVTVAQQFPGMPTLPGGINIPGLPGGASTGFAGLGALTAAKELTGQKDKTSYPTPNIAVSGNHIVIAWPNGVVSVETIANDGTLTRTVLGPPTENNITSGKK